MSVKQRSAESDILITVELGGSSRQTCVFVNDDAVLLVNDRMVTSERAQYSLATPGVIRDGRLFYARNLGVNDGTTLRAAAQLPSEPNPAANDAIAAAAGEWFLRRNDGPVGNLLYVGLGTGVGSARVVDDERLEETNLGHSGEWSRDSCPGCGRIGCLDTVISGRVLPNTLSSDDERFLAETLWRAIDSIVRGGELIVIAGGLVEANPGILHRLKNDGRLSAHGTAAPAGFKSAAPYGLLAVNRGLLTVKEIQ